MPCPSRQFWQVWLCRTRGRLDIELLGRRTDRALAHLDQRTNADRAARSRDCFAVYGAFCITMFARPSFGGSLYDQNGYLSFKPPLVQRSGVGTSMRLHSQCWWSYCWRGWLRFEALHRGTSKRRLIQGRFWRGDAVLNQTPVDLGIPFVHETEHPAFYRYRESYPRRNGSPRNCSSRAGDERSAVPVCV